MGMTTMIKKLKFIALTSFILLHVYIITPVINGVGCNYNSEANDVKMKYISTCRLGIVETIAWNKLSGEKKLFKGILAKKHNDLFFFVVYSKELSKPLFDFDDGLNVRFSDAYIYSAKQIHAGQYYWVLLRNPSYRIYKVNMAGKLGFW
ncbi:TPA: hypothetical protein ACGD2I_002174 [Aeromonas hydrophila]|uniref:hypothetical protein n=1 Tax=Aeromonas hydrophila TaxID=644 RepID=UPI0021E87E90|nr:hypothetical protein [Aeromonas hydrophila]MCV3293191.1 hypothetical protein [Aeromonas hydrophila]